MVRSVLKLKLIVVNNFESKNQKKEGKKMMYLLEENCYDYNIP